jgi:hypothetical protein
MVIPGLYAKLMAALSAPAGDDPRLTMQIGLTDDPAERDELEAHADAERVAANRRARAERERRQRTGESFKVARWQVIDRDVRQAVRHSGSEIADRAHTEYSVGPDDVVRPVAKGYGIERQEWTVAGWISVPSIVRQPVARPDS